MHNIDYTGISVLIGAIVAAVPIIGGFILQVISFIDQRHIKKAQLQLQIDSVRREAKLDVITKQTNGIVAATANLAYRAGAAETAAGIAPSPISTMSEQTEPAT